MLNIVGAAILKKINIFFIFQSRIYILVFLAGSDYLCGISPKTN
jgi:hypothetical protein